MQYLENDMDELFRKAADNYPLRTETSDWDKIAMGLDKVPPGQLTSPGSKRKYAVLLLLGIVFISGGVLWLRPHQVSSQADTRISVAESKKERPERKNSPVGNTDHEIVNTTTYFAPRATYESPAGISGNTTVNLSGIESGQKKTGLVESPEIFQVDPAKPGSSIFRRDIAGLEIPVAKPDPISKAKKKKGFYYGFVTGPQFNQVKGQGFYKAGLSSGILVGFGKGGPVSLETGLLFTRKHYTSEGRYFDMNKASTAMPSGMKVLSLKGHSSVYEIPLRVKVDFLSKGKGKFFSTAGISSYLLKKETNDYRAMINGVEQNMAGDYQKIKTYLAGSFNLSAGYQYNIGKQVSLRVEPYIQIPIQGLGIGSMPVSSTGLHIGIVWGNKK